MIKEQPPELVSIKYLDPASVSEDTLIWERIVAVIEFDQSVVSDPTWGPFGMFMQIEKFIEAHGGNIGDVCLYGEESKYTTWRLCYMHLAIRGISGF